MTYEPMPTMPTQQRPLHDDAGLLHNTLLRTDAGFQTKGASQKLDDIGKNDMAGKNQGGAGEACDCCAMIYTYKSDCQDCMQRLALRRQVERIKQSNKGEWA